LGLDRIVHFETKTATAASIQWFPNHGTLVWYLTSVATGFGREQNNMRLRTFGNAVFKPVRDFARELFLVLR